jgi:hypothetical protein
MLEKEMVVPKGVLPPAESAYPQGEEAGEVAGRTARNIPPAEAIPIATAIATLQNSRVAIAD